MFVNISLLLTTIGLLFFLGLLRLFVPLVKENRRGKKVLHGVGGERGLKPHWLLGHLREIQPTAESFKYMTDTFLPIIPKISQLWIGPFVWYLGVHHPHVLPPLLNTAEPKDFLAYGFFKDWIGDGLLTSTGKKWQRNRRLLTKAFHFDILRRYTEIFNKGSDVMLTKWKDAAELGKKVEVYGDVTLMTLDNLLQCIMSCETNCQTDKNGNRYVGAVFALTQIVVKRMFNPLVHSDFIFYLTPAGRRFKSLCDYVHKFDEKMIEERKCFIKKILKNNDGHGEESDIELYQKVSGRRLDFLDVLLLTRDEDGKGLTDREIRDEVDTFLFEGHDTTASGISWAFYCLASYPQYQERCREEILEALGQKKVIYWNDLSKLPYLAMFVKETMRLYPPVFFIARKTTKPIYFPRGFGKDQFCLDDKPLPDCSRTIEPNTNINISAYFIHRNPAVWENSEVFDPTRFTPENVKNRSSFAYVPFSAGPRNCIGKNFALSEIKVTIIKALQRFQFYLDADCPKPEIYPAVILKAKSGIYVKAKPL